MVSTTEDPMLFNFETTYEASFTNGTDQSQGFFPQFFNIRRLLEMRMVLCGIGLTVNSLILLLQMKLKTFKKTQFIFAFALTATDGIVCPATFMETYLYYKGFVPVPVVYQAINSATSAMSYFVIIAVAFDRYLALCALPFKYKLVVNLKRYGLVIIAMCALSAGYGFVSTFNLTEHLTRTGLSAFIVSTTLIDITVLIYIFVFISLSRSHKALSLPKDMKNVRIRQTRRLMFAFGLILGTNVICNLPQPIFGLYIFFQPFGQGYQIYKNAIISNWLYNLRCVNYTLNPIIYWWQVLVRDFTFPWRKKAILKTNSSSIVREVSTVTKKSDQNSTRQ